MTIIRSDQWLSVFLLLALLSNATLLLILTYNAFHDDACPSSSRSCGEHLEHAAANEQSPLQDKRTQVADLRARKNRFTKIRRGPSQGTYKNAHSNAGALPDISKLPHFLRYESGELNSFKGDQVQQDKIRGKTFAQDTKATGEHRWSTKITLFLELYRQLSTIVPKLKLSTNNGANYKSLKSMSQTADNTASSPTPLLFERPSGEGKQLNPKELSTKSQKSISDENTIVGKSREKRDTALMELEAGADGTYLNYEFQFAKLAENESLELLNQTSDVLIPRLIKFEDRMIRHVEELHFTMLSHDLRLERVERAVINMVRGPTPNQGKRRRRGDILLEPDPSDELRKLAEGSDNTVFFSNNSQWLQGNASLEELEGESSGEGGINSTVTPSTTTTTSTTSTTTTTTTSQPMVYYDLQRDMQEMKHKVLALENYNTMSDSELTRVRSEVMRMDDKVIEMQRTQKNANSITGQHTYKINELEMVMNRNSMALTTTMDAYSRLNSRVGEFRDRLGDFERDIHGVSTHFSKHEQISNELRSADSYKAHDIMEIRKAMVNVETRINEMYNVMDQRIEGVHSNIRDLLERLCFNNNLAC